MKIAAVAAISFFDNVILQKIVEVEDNATWKEALSKAIVDGLFGEVTSDENRNEWIFGLSDDITIARRSLGDGEMDICVTFFNI